ncbi:MAG TPA: hypothetical protein DEF07_04265 [Nitrosomonas sp.]|nr:hypothetical protein [Nitrosomonas sp.]
MIEQRILLIGGVSLVKGRVKESGLVMKEICDELEPMLQEIGFVDNAPFKTVSMIIRFGEKTDLTPDYDPINKRYSELPVAVEMELASLRIASKETLKNAFVKATIDVLIDIARKYNLPCESLEAIAAP